MINAVIELGGRRVHEVMVPRIAIVGAAGVGHVRRGDRHDRRGGPLARARLRVIAWTRSSASSTPRTCCRSSSPTAAARSEPADDAAHPGLRARVDVHRRPPPRVPAAQGPHRHRARRVRRHRGPGHDRGPARGDRRRDPGRVRRGGAARSSCWTTDRGPRGRPRVDRRPAGALGHASCSSRTRTSTTRSAASCTTASAGCPSRATRSAWRGSG